MLQRIVQCHVQSKASLGKLRKGQGKKILYYPGLSLNLRRHVVYQVCCYMTKEAKELLPVHRNVATALAKFCG
jgi:hypothetical protein